MRRDWSNFNYAFFYSSIGKNISSLSIALAILPFTCVFQPRKLSAVDSPNAKTISQKISIRWCRAGGRKMAGLLRRRNAERDLFLS